MESQWGNRGDGQRYRRYVILRFRDRCAPQKRAKRYWYGEKGVRERWVAAGLARIGE